MGWTSRKSKDGEAKKDTGLSINRQVLDENNKIRLDPKSYIQHLEENLK